MSGGITQLVAVGIQDAYLSGTPEVSFFRSSFKRYTHFAQNIERQIIQGNPVQGGISLLRFEKKGDLLSDVYLTAQDPNNSSNVNVNWSTIISKLELMIGGQIIDTQDMTYCSNIEPVTNSHNYSQRLVPPNLTGSVFFPFKFFFCKDWQSALPLVALQYHDVEVRITWANPNAWDQYIAWARFLYLDNDEREWFAKKSHDMLITQITRVPIAPVNNYEFALAQPIKYIAFESNSYVNTYNQTAATTTFNMPFYAPPEGVFVGMLASISGYVSNALITNVITANNNVTVTYPSQVINTIPANSQVNFAPVTLTSNGNATATAGVVNLTFTGNLQANYGITSTWTAIASSSGITTAATGLGVISAQTYYSANNNTTLTLTYTTLAGTSAAWNVVFVPFEATKNTLVTAAFAPVAAGGTSNVSCTSNVAINAEMVGWSVVMGGAIGTASPLTGVIQSISALVMVQQVQIQF